MILFTKPVVTLAIFSTPFAAVLNGKSLIGPILVVCQSLKLVDY